MNFIFIFCLFFVTSVLAQVNPPVHGILSQHKQNFFNNFYKLNTSKTPLNQSMFDALYYRLELSINFNPNNLTGKVLGRYRILAESLDQLILDFDEGMNVAKVTGAVQNFTHANQYLTINLDRTYFSGETIEISVEYSGIPNSGNNRWFVFDRLNDGSDHLWTLSEPYGAKFWWPCKDSPKDKADSVDILITVPEYQIAASNGTLLSDIFNGDGTRTFYWREKYPIATYLVSLAIAPYVNFTDQYTLQNGEKMLLDYYVYPQSESIAREIFPDVKDHLDGLSHYFGSYPFSDEKYGMAQFGWGGAMEHQTLSSIGRVSAEWEYIYVHELAHQWFGDALTCASWADIWLNEGFASYAEALYAEWAGYADNPPGSESYHAYINSQRYLQGGTIQISDTTNVANIFDRIVYDKGSWVLHMLRYVLGDTDFFEVLNSYANHAQLKYNSVTTEDFIDVCEMVSGKELSIFFDQWLNYPLYPNYVFSWKQVIAQAVNKTGVEVTILQEQNNPLYHLPLDLQFIFSSGKDSLVRIENNRKEQIYTFELNEIPLQVKLDPNNWILKNVRDESAGNFSKKIKIENVYPNPTNSVTNIIVNSWQFGDLILGIYDTRGKLVKELKPYFISTAQRFYFSWQGTNKNNQLVSDGIYFIQAVQNGQISSKVQKVVVLK